MVDPEDVQMAASISVVACSCGSIYVRLHDRTGAIFAAACMPPETAMGFLEQTGDALEESIAAAKADTIGECQGHG